MTHKTFILNACMLTLSITNLIASLNTNFGSGGIVTAPAGFLANAVAVQPDGKIVVTGTTNSGTIQTVRYLSTGTLDHSFGANGAVITADVGTPYALLVQPDSKIVIAGQLEGGQSIIYRYLSNGTSDAPFGSHGIVLGNLITLSSIDIQNDGSLVVSGTDINGMCTVIRYTMQGTIDTQFDTVLRGTGHDLIIASDGTIIVGGTDSAYAFYLIRYNSDGTLDTNFGTNGIAHGPAGNLMEICLQPDGKILAAGDTGLLDDAFQIARFNSNGSLDTSFGNNGVTTGPLGTGNALLLQGLNNKAIVIGQATENSYQVARYTTNGILDSSFNTTGFIINPAGIALCGALQANGNIIAAGLDAHFSDFQLAQYVGGINAALRPTTITAPNTGATLPIGTLNFAGNAQHPSRIFIAIDGTVVGGAATNASNRWACALPFTTPGKHSVQAVSWSKNGKTALASQPVTINVTGPTLTATIQNNFQGRPVRSGTALNYTITVTNNDIIDATNVIITDTLPDALTYTLSRLSNGGSISVEGNRVIAHIGALFVGQTVTLTLNTRTQALTAGSSVRNTAIITTVNAIPVNATNLVSVT